MNDRPRRKPDWFEVLVGGGMITLAGCTIGPPASRLNVSYDEQRPELVSIASLFTSMADNALQSTMSMSDVYFVANTTELNSAGVKRLTRYAKLLQPYGGTIHYETTSTDQEEIAAKVAHIKDVLVATGLDVSHIQVEAGPARGVGMSAEEAIKAKDGGVSETEQDQSGVSLTDMLSQGTGGPSR
ncbi:MAG: hypothetical protein IID39_02995 [Planctomycetes bacterium]|nr:hypothetical protein [Planctomycetota bacterium]